MVLLKTKPLKANWVGMVLAIQSHVLLELTIKQSVMKEQEKNDCVKTLKSTSKF